MDSQFMALYNNCLEELKIGLKPDTFLDAHNYGINAVVI